jgi:hypothetical protein
MVTEAGIRREIESYVRKVAREEAQKAAKQQMLNLANVLVALDVIPSSALSKLHR